MKKILLPLLFLLVACVDVNPPRSGASIGFLQYQPIYLKVSRIEVLEDYHSPMRSPYVEHTLPYTPADGMHIWTAQRVKATGGDKMMQVVIKDASVKETALPTTGGLGGMFSSEPDTQYDARLEVELRIYGDAPLSEANVNVVATRMRTMNNSDSAATRQMISRVLVKELLEVANAELEKNIFQHLAPYIDYSVTP